MTIGIYNESDTGAPIHRVDPEIFQTILTAAGAHLTKRMKEEGEFFLETDKRALKKVLELKSRMDLY